MILNRKFAAVCLALATAPLGAAFAQGAASAAATSLVTPPAALVLDGVPPVPKSVADQVAAYTDFRPTGFASWHPTKLEMVISRRHKNTPQIYRLSAPGATAELMTDYAEPVRAGSYAPISGKYYLFGKDTGGNEVNRVWRKDVGAAADAEPVAVTPANKRVQGLAWANTSDRVVYTVVPVNRQGSADTIKTEVFIADPLKPEDAKKIAELDGGGWFGFTFSPDDKTLAYFEYVSANESYIWLMDVANGKSRRLTEKNGTESVAYGDIAFSSDGKHLFTATDRGSEFQRLTMIEIATGKQTTITKDINWDVQSIDVTRDGKLIAFVINEDGTGKLRIMRTADNTFLPAPKLPLGTIGGVSWHRNSTDLGFSLVSATSPSEVYSLNTKTNTVTRWTTHEKMAVDPAAFPEPELVRWKSFDGRMISGFLYRAPAAKFPGKRPVLINIHGGPEAQATTGFLGRNNYYLNEMGISIIFPNVRGSAGYGKSFLKLDNGKLREDSVKDIGALFDWIGTQKDLDASRVVVTGGSYGGYMTLAVTTMYPERIAGALSVVGISNFVTFLERTESYRRDLRRVEYGDERDPEMRKWMEEIAPLNRANRIKRPLFVVQGKNDPRVPWQEAQQIVETVKKTSVPVWYMLANDEGHGFAKKANADYQFYATIAFLQQTMLAK